MRIYPVVTAIHIAFGAFTLLYLPCLIRARNVGLSFFVIWMSLLCFSYAANTVVWKDNALDSAPVWCDIYVRLSVGASVAPSGCSLAVVRRLYITACSRRIVASQKQRRWDLFVDLWLCIGLPLLVICLFYVVQGHRYDIYEELGCSLAILNTPLTYVLVLMWPLLLGVVSAVYSCLIIHTFSRHRSDLYRFLAGGSSGINYSLFCRIFSLTLVDALVTIPLSIVIIYGNTVISPIRPYTSWSDVHYNFSRVVVVPSVFWRYAYEQDTTGWIRFAIAWRNMMYPFCAFIFLAIYGTSMEILWFYRDLVRRGVEWIKNKRTLSSEKALVKTNPGNGTVFTSVLGVEGVSVVSNCCNSRPVTTSSAESLA